MPAATPAGLGGFGLVSETMVEPFVHEGLPVRVVLGPGTLRQLPDEVRLSTDGRVLLIASPSAADAADRLDLDATRFTEVRRHVPLDLAERARTRARDSSAIVCIGGGSATGLAKAVALTTGQPIIAVPTTYAGSEMTPVWGLTSDGEKTTGTDPRVLPRTVVYDPELSLDLPHHVTVPSVANAMAHCIGATRDPRANPITDLTAIEAARILADGLRTLDIGIVARSNLLHGACLAGNAMATAGTGLHHRICHVLGGRYDLPHAETHAAVLPYSTAQDDRLAAAIGTEDLASGLYDLFRPRSLRELGLTEHQLEDLPDEMRGIARAAWEGVRPSDVPRRA